ncbi:MAG TPA: hypothetical protein ENI29_21225 [bacterium]|nr:hypothetical protein [bacterium]
MTQTSMVQYLQNNIKNKQCSKCKKWKPATTEFFHKGSSTKDGLHSHCKVCRTGNNHARKRYTIEECRDIALQKGGKCLSNVYKNVRPKMRWECNDGHIWETAFTNIINKNAWCPYCAKNRRLTLEECKEFAKSKKGKCLSNIYINSRTKMEWKCEHGHIWKAAFYNIKNHGQWCNQCGGTKKHTIKYCREVAKERNGKCLSKKYKNNKVKLQWRCKNRHIFMMKLNDVLSNHWCPYCSESKFEKECRSIMERLYNAKFPTRTIVGKKGLGNGAIHLDGYNPYIKVAFEANGMQHYEQIKHWHKTKDDFLQQQEHDIIKKEYTKKHNIKLIIIPYWEKDNIEKYIFKVLKNGR